MNRRINVATFSSTGIVRERNEDTIFVNSKNLLFGVCDGMGGLKYGKKAAELVSEYFQQCSMIDNNDVSQMEIPEEQVIQEMIYDINQRIAFNNYPWYVRYGCALCGIWIVSDNDAIVFNLGDSRCYIFKYNSQEGELLTRDHNRASELKNKNVTDGNFDNKIERNILTKYIGKIEENEPNICKVSFRQGDRFLICTDGLYNELSKKQIENILYNHEYRDIEEVGRILVKKSIAAGGRDNISVVLIDIIG